MLYPRFAYIPQAVFSNQRDNERVFVVVRRHYVDFILSSGSIFALIIIPIILAIISPTFLSEILYSDQVFARDVITIIALAYFLVLTIFFITTWISYYYNLLIITDERIIEVAQSGFFNRELNELAFEQIEDVSYRTQGMLNTIYEVGDIEIQTAGSQRNFLVRRVPKPRIIFGIIHDLSSQAKDGVENEDRMPTIETIGLLGGRPVLKNSVMPPVMNFRGGLIATRNEFKQSMKPAKTLRQKFDRWWWTHMKGEKAIFINYEEENMDTQLWEVDLNRKSELEEEEAKNKTE